MSSSLRAFSEGSDGSDMDSGPEDTPDSDNTLAPFVLAVTISSLAAREANRLEYEAKLALEEAQSAYKKAREVTKEAVAKVKIDEAAWKKYRSGLRQEAGMSYGAAEELERTQRRQERMEAQRAAHRQEQQPAARPPTRHPRRTRKRARGEGEAAADAAALRAVGKGPVVEGEGGEDSSDKGALAAGSALCPPPSPTPPSVSDSGSDGGGGCGTAGHASAARYDFAAAKAAAATARPPAVTGVSVPTDTRVPAPAVAFADEEEADRSIFWNRLMPKVGWKQGTRITDEMMDEALQYLPAQHPGALERLAATDPGISESGTLTWQAIVRAKVVLVEAMTRNAGVTGDEAVTGAIAASTAPLCPAPSSPPVCLYRHNG